MTHGESVTPRTKLHSLNPTSDHLTTYLHDLYHASHVSYVYFIPPHRSNELTKKTDRMDVVDESRRNESECRCRRKESDGMGVFTSYIEIFSLRIHSLFPVP